MSRPRPRRAGVFDSSHLKKTRPATCSRYYNSNNKCRAKRLDNSHPRGGYGRSRGQPTLAPCLARILPRISLAHGGPYYGRGTTRHRILADRRSPTRPRPSRGSRRTSKAATSNASSSGATSTSASLGYPSSPVAAGGGGGCRGWAPRAISRLRWSARGGASCMRSRERCTASGERMRTWPPSLRHSALFSFCSWADWPLTSLGRAARRGIWQGGTDIESPGDYKRRYLTGEQARIEEVAELEVLEPEPEPKGFLSWIIGRSKRGGG